MRMILVICFALGLALVGAPAAAQDAEALRRELEQLQVATRIPTTSRFGRASWSSSAVPTS
jgi:hypothetical protein